MHRASSRSPTVVTIEDLSRPDQPRSGGQAAGLRPSDCIAITGLDLSAWNAVIFRVSLMRTMLVYRPRPQPLHPFVYYISDFCSRASTMRRGRRLPSQHRRAAERACGKLGRIGTATVVSGIEDPETPRPWDRLATSASLTCKSSHYRSGRY